MNVIEERPTLTQKALTRMYRESQIVLDPKAYTRDCIAKARAELDARHGFFIVPDLNKPTWHEPGNPDNLTDEERERWFGKSHNLHPDDVSWEKLENILIPSARRGTVGRVNGALDGSHNNERFSAMIHSSHPNRAGFTEAQYTPRTISIYDSKEQAVVAAKVLRILTKDDSGKGSVASILAEAIENGRDEPVWVVSDNMNLQTHNALRLYFTNQAHKLSPIERGKKQRHSQEAVNCRLPAGENWEAFEGVPTLLTLQGRPGVKMFKKLPDGEDDPEDVAQLARLPKQDLPRIVKGVPHELVIASDGRQYFDPGDTFATVACVLVGPRGYTFLRTGNTKMIGELMKNEAAFAAKPFQARSTFELGHAGADAVESTLSFLANRTLSLSAGMAAVLLHGSAIAAGTSFYSLFKRFTGSDPMKNSIKQWVEKRCGPLEETKLYKVWELREEMPAIHATPIDQSSTEPQAPGVVNTPLGDVAMDTQACKALLWKEPYKKPSHFKTQKPPSDIAHDFLRYMTHNKRWPSSDQLEVRNRIPDDFFKKNSHYYRTRDDLALDFARWFSETFTPGKTAPEDSTAATQLAKSIQAFTDMLRSTRHLPTDASNAMLEAMRTSLTRGMGDYLKKRAVQQTHART